MAAANVLTTGSTAASSNDVAVAATTAFGLKEYASGAHVDVELKDDAASYNPIGVLNAGQPMIVIIAPATYRFTRRAGAACGVYSG